MYNVLISGATGRMGKEVSARINENKDLQIVCGFDREEDFSSSFPIYSKLSDITENIDVIIDFSHPSMTMEILKYAKENNIPIVIATTGFSKEEENTIKEYSKVIPIFKSANMSFSINLMCKILQEVAPMLSDADIEITETHHRNKKDAPSGTALLLANKINESLGNNMNYMFDRHSVSQKRSNNEIGFSSIRGGNIVGEHTVQFFSDFETFEIKHTCHSRSVFADGAVKAALFVVRKSAGMYTMDDLIQM